jgi:AcrR family transcriptional regulator
MKQQFVEPESRSKKGENTRNEILAAAASILRRGGYAEMSLRDVASLVNMKAGSLYYHFASKEELAIEVMRIGVEAVERAVRDALEDVPSDDSEQRLKVAIRIHLDTLLRRSEFASSHIRCYPFVPDNVRFELHNVRLSYDQLWLELIGDYLNLRGRDEKVSYVRHILIGAINQSPEWFNPNRHSIEHFAAQIEVMLGNLRKA